MKGLLSIIWSVISGKTRYEEMTIDESLTLSSSAVRVSHDNLPLSITVARKKLELMIYPEVFLESNADSHPDSFVIVNLQSPHTGIQGFVRLEKAGDSVVLGSHDPLQAKLLNYPERIDLRFLEITHDDDALIFHALAFDVDVHLRVMDREIIDQIQSKRRQLLGLINDVYGGPIQQLSFDEAMSTIQSVNEILEHEPCRAKDKRGKAGGVIEISPDLTPIIIGDLHSQVDNLLTILSQDGVLPALEDGIAVLIILGDAVHSEIPGELDKMDDSLLIMDLIFKLKTRYPEQVFYIRGNHDSFSDNVFKAGIAQCLMWERAIRESRGSDYLEEFKRFYELLPYVVMSQDFVACHAAPIRTHFNKEMLINIYEHKGLVRELTRNRLRRRDFPAGYHKADVYHFKKELGVSEHTQFLVSHSPLNRTDPLWREAGRIPDHHIVFSANIPWVGMFSRINGHILPLSYHREPIGELLDTIM